MEKTAYDGFYLNTKKIRKWVICYRFHRLKVEKIQTYSSIDDL